MMKRILINDEPCDVYITDTHVIGDELIIDDINHVKPKEQHTSPFTVWSDDYKRDNHIKGDIPP